MAAEHPSTRGAGNLFPVVVVGEACLRAYMLQDDP